MSRHKSRSIRTLVATLLAAAVLSISLRAADQSPKAANSNGKSATESAKPAVADKSGKSAVEQALDKEVALKYVDTPLADVAKSLSDMTGVNVLLDLKPLKEASVDGATQVTFEISRVPLRTSLQFILNDMDLAYVPADDDILLITTEARAKEKVVVEVYDVHDLVRSANVTAGARDIKVDWLVEAITSFIAPTTWTAAGGSGSLQPFGGALVVSQTGEVQEMVAGFLEALRIARDLPEQNRAGIAAELQIEVAADIKIKEALQARHDFEFKESPLAEVARRVSALGVPTVLDTKALKEADVDGKTPITFSAKNMSIATMFKLALEPLDLACIIDHGVALVTTNAVPSEKTTVVVYPVGDLIDAANPDEAVDERYRSLINVVVNSVIASGWSRSGGRGDIQPAPPVKSLVISQTADGHRECAELFAKLRAKLPTTPSPGHDPHEIVLRIYRLHKNQNGDPSLDDLIATIHGVVGQRAWTVEGTYVGKAAGDLVVRQSRAVQKQIGGLLLELGVSTEDGGSTQSPFGGGASRADRAKPQPGEKSAEPKKIDPFADPHDTKQPATPGK